ncbi:MAG: hypothetical protein HYX50_01180, partial [Chloroflexi bacterium]|nr:hypothetical protein [Chloroflexota bacterium]
MSVDTPAAARLESDPRPHDAPRVPARRLPLAQPLILLLLFTLAMIPRAAWVAYNDREPQGLNDPALYDLLAGRMADGLGYTRPTG